MAVAVEQEHVEHHAPPRPPARGIRRFTRPGWLRALWVTPLTFGLVTGIICLIRWGGRDGVASDPIWDLPTLLSFWTIFVPIGFLAGLGAFDYWAYWISGRPTRPEDHSGHGADSWKDYFRVNTDHKVIGVQYLVTTFSFFAIAGLLALFMRAELAQPGSQFVDTQTFNGLFSSHAGIMIFLFIVPVFAGFGNYVIPLMIGAPDMAFPRLNALSFWLLPIAGLIMLFGFLLPGGEYAAGWTNYPPLVRPEPGREPHVPDGRAVGRCVLDPHRAQLPRHDHHDARAGHDVLAPAAARLGELHDLAARRSRHAVHRRLAVPAHARPRRCTRTSSIPPAAAGWSATSTSSGSTHTPPSTS